MRQLSLPVILGKDFIACTPHPTPANVRGKGREGELEFWIFNFFGGGQNFLISGGLYFVRGSQFIFRPFSHFET